MGLSVAEYFAQKEACASCVDHGTEEHCVTTLLSRKENCFVYSIIHNQIGEYKQQEIELLRRLINTMLEVLEKENNIPKELNEFKYY